MSQENSPRWFTAIPLRYTGGSGWWIRDAGLYCLGIRELGMESRFVCLGEPEVHKDMPLVTCGLDEMMDADWWRRWKLDGVILFAWGLPRFTGIARAIKESGAKLVLKLDADGARTTAVWPAQFLRAKWIDHKERSRPLPWLWAAVSTLGSHLLRKRRNIGTIRHLEYGDVLAIESPLARQRFFRFLEDCNGTHLADRLKMIPHPVSTVMSYDAGVKKEKLLVAVGRWDALVKGGPLLVDVLSAVVRLHPDYRARIIGGGEDFIRSLVSKMPSEIRDRIQITGPIPHAELVHHFRSARVMVNTSYSESFNLAAAEALCCGASLVGSSWISSFNYMTSTASGTLATVRNFGHMRDAILAEIGAWEAGERDPRAISDIWAERLHVTKVARRTIDLANSVPVGQPGSEIQTSQA